MTTLTCSPTRDALGAPAEEPKVVEVAIADLLRDPMYQVRKALDRGMVDRYAAVYSSENTMPPVKAAHVNGTLVLVDGWHRVAALERLGVRTVMAEIIPATDREALWLAAKANLANGLPLKQAEVRRVFRSYIRARKHLKGPEDVKSYREIAQDIGGLVRHTTVRNWMMKDFPKIAARMSSEGCGVGGLVDTRVENPFKAAAADSLQQALVAFRGLTDPGHRGEVLMLADTIIAEMRAGGEWREPDPLEF